MTKSIRVSIGGKDYSLSGENEELLRQSAHEVDSTFVHLKQRTNEQSTSTLAVLTALNLAEEKIVLEDTVSRWSDSVSSRLDSMASELASVLTD